MAEPLTKLTSRTVVLPAENIDTDQIIPARFLTVTSRDGLGVHAFHDWRWHDDGSPTDHMLNSTEAQAAQILVGGHNFGCGSSREHAPWALTDYGFRVIISSEIADIFRTNSVKNGLLPIVIDRGAHQWLLDHPGAEVSVDLSTRLVHLPGNGGTYAFEVDDFSAHCLMEGVDELGYLEGQTDAIAAFEANR
ncbi:3-isopropylmalate dehydratase small subunit [Algimonas porphyrae]|uniref:3-isopropylmalate dehydratase n=1 Tax=Algimonas porphyrae TaxID=1128113 RepID=A0ABQ5V108_9PROT|nr:3-isopropylmalate dehydratase small subunit [Algimonas porphyrae]GLQ21136.1 3-isopropylmalate dehydratase small subunit [Algimonas porphyrae]